MPRSTFDLINPTLTAAQISSSGTDKSTTCRLLEALSKNERDSDLGLLAHAILHGGDYYTRNADDMDDVAGYTAEIRKRAEMIAEEYDTYAAHHMAPIDH